MLAIRCRGMDQPKPARRFSTPGLLSWRVLLFFSFCSFLTVQTSLVGLRGKDRASAQSEKKTSTRQRVCSQLCMVVTLTDMIEKMQCSSKVGAGKISFSRELHSCQSVYYKCGSRNRGWYGQPKRHGFLYSLIKLCWICLILELISWKDGQWASELVLL